MRRACREEKIPDISVHSLNIILYEGARFPPRYAPSLMEKKKKKNCTKEENKKRGGEEEEECRWELLWEREVEG